MLLSWMALSKILKHAMLLNSWSKAAQEFKWIETVYFCASKIQADYKY